MSEPRPHSTRRTLIAAAVLVCAGLVVGATVKALHDAPNSSTGATGAGSTGSSDAGAPNAGAAAYTGLTDYAAAQRAAVPDLSGTTISGTSFSLSQDLGHVTVLNVWASWCTQCQVEVPVLTQTYAAYEGRGVDFIGLDIADPVNAAQAFAASAHFAYPSLSDPHQSLVLQLKSFVPPDNAPSTLIIDAQGRIAARIIGPATYAELSATLNDLLGTATATATSSPTGTTPAG